MQVSWLSCHQIMTMKMFLKTYFLISKQVWSILHQRVCFYHKSLSSKHLQLQKLCAKKNPLYFANVMGRWMTCQALV